MNERTIVVAERALMGFLKKTQSEHDYFRGRLIQADDLPAPKQQIISAAISKVNWYVVELDGLKGELEMLREELEALGAEEDTDQEET